MARARSFRELAELEQRILDRAARQRTPSGRKKRISRLSDNAASLTRQYRENIKNAYRGYAADFKKRYNDALERSRTSGEAFVNDKGQTVFPMRDTFKALENEKNTFQNKKISPRIYRQGMSVG